MMQPGMVYEYPLWGVGLLLADGARQAMLSLSLMRLSDARQERLMAADTTVPAVVWIVTLMGGALTVAFASLLGVPSLAMHLAMSATMAISGALVLIMIIALSNPFRGDAPRLTPSSK